MLILAREHRKNPNDGHGESVTFKVQKAFATLGNAESHVRYLRSRYTANGYTVTQTGPDKRTPEGTVPRELMGLDAYVNRDDGSGSETFVYTITEISGAD